jgi:LPS-assembly protein
VSARGDIAYSSLDTSGQFNQYLPNFIDTSGEVLGRFMPAAGVTYRYPFVAMNDFGTHVIEPVAQLIVRPNETQIGALPNEDAQSLIYDDTNLFEINKFSGYDRVEGGTRANIGAQYILTTPGGSYFNALFGQSYQLAGVNSFATPDIARTGLDSGLDSSRSDYVSRLQFTPVSNFSFLARSRWSEEDFSMKSLELQGVLQLEKFSASVTYARYAAQPQLGFYQTSKGVIANTKLNLDKNWYVSAAALVDLDGYSAESELINGGLSANQGAQLGYLSLGAGYQDECTTFGIVYMDSAQSATGTRDRSQTVMLRLELRTLGAVNVSQNIGALASDTPLGMAP